MNVHRQTVLYRIRKVEELTGAQLSTTPATWRSCGWPYSRVTCWAAT